jgi:hypothetical protein
MFGGDMLPQYSGLKREICLLSAHISLGLNINPEVVGYIFLRNVCRLSADYTVIISQYIELFITTAVRTSNPANSLETLSMSSTDITWYSSVFTS